MSEQVKAIIAAAEKEHLVEILYRKSPADRALARIIEAYSLTEGKQDIMIRAWQVSPEETGWKYFMDHRIVSASDTGKPFRPRRKITITTGEVYQTYEPWDTWNQAVAGYRDLVLDVIADMQVTIDEVRQVQARRLELEVSDDMARSVHASILNACLTHMLTDGRIDDDERHELSKLQACFDQLGWAVGD